MHVCTGAHVCVCIGVHVCVRVCMGAHVCVCLGMCTCVCLCVCLEDDFFDNSKMWKQPISQECVIKIMTVC